MRQHVSFGKLKIDKSPGEAIREGRSSDGAPGATICCYAGLMVAALLAEGAVQRRVPLSQPIFSLLCRLEGLMSVSVIKLSVAYLSGVTAGVQICQRCLVSHAANYRRQARNWREISVLDGIQSAFGTKIKRNRR